MLFILKKREITFCIRKKKNKIKSRLLKVCVRVLLYTTVRMSMWLTLPSSWAPAKLSGELHSICLHTFTYSLLVDKTYEIQIFAYSTKHLHITNAYNEEHWTLNVDKTCLNVYFNAVSTISLHCWKLFFITKFDVSVYFSLGTFDFHSIIFSLKWIIHSKSHIIITIETNLMICTRFYNSPSSKCFNSHLSKHVLEWGMYFL